MIVPAKYQIFSGFAVLITDKDADRLKAHLSGWPHLHLMFQLGVFNEADLKRLVILELMDRQRIAILKRLLGRLETVQRKEVWRKVERVLRKIPHA